jgi:hypothetical protein
VALSTNKKIAIAVGATAAVVLIGSAVLAKPKKELNFNTRNIDALNAVVDAMIADPNLQAGPLNAFADHLSYYGLQEQEQKMRARANRAPKAVDKTVPFHGF